MDTPGRVEAYIASQPEAKQTDLRQLHPRMLAEFPDCRLWFDDGTNEDGKVVSNPNIGYGVDTIAYAAGSSQEFYRIGLSANTTGISVYVLGLDDKTYLARTHGASIGKASVTGYCIRFRRLSVINADALHAAIRHGSVLAYPGDVGGVGGVGGLQHHIACERADLSRHRDVQAAAGSSLPGPGKPYPSLSRSPCLRGWRWA